MKYHRYITRKSILKLSLIIVLGVIFNQAFAAYEITHYTINNGGSKMVSARFQMTSSIGQVDASNTMSDTNYSINSGFWHTVDSAPRPNSIFNNGFE